MVPCLALPLLPLSLPFLLPTSLNLCLSSHSPHFLPLLLLALPYPCLFHLILWKHQKGSWSTKNPCWRSPFLGSVTWSINPWRPCSEQIWSQQPVLALKIIPSNFQEIFQMHFMIIFIFLSLLPQDIYFHTFLIISGDINYNEFSAESVTILRTALHIKNLGMT